ncbi:pro-Pol polyprotein [Trichonephila clavipes]|nr:pro-Pol polyprotein [Trichonephila clavipes]
MEEKQNCIQTLVNKGTAQFVTRSRRWKVTSRLLHVEKDEYSRRKCSLPNYSTTNDEENIQHLQIATGVPRRDGKVERIHRTLIPVLTKLSLDDSTKWYKYVDRLQRILNSTISRSTKWTHFELLVGTKNA